MSRLYLESPLGNEKRVLVALHESGHAVMGLVLEPFCEARVGRVSIQRDRMGEGSTHFAIEKNVTVRALPNSQPWSALARLDLAGSAAVRVGAGYPAELGSEDDLEAARGRIRRGLRARGEVAGTAQIELFLLAESLAATALMGYYFEHVERLAGALLESGKIVGRENIALAAGFTTG